MFVSRAKKAIRLISPAIEGGIVPVMMVGVVKAVDIVRKAQSQPLTTST
jgi:hypothetical protein